MLAAVAVLVLLPAGRSSGRSDSPAPLYNPVFLNIGFVCRWDRPCMDRQDDAMKRSLKFVRKKNPPAWRLQLCNRNAGRRGERVDWIGFDHCIRNTALTPPPPPQQHKRRTHVIAERGR